ncbi:hypothetical protein AB0H98_22575 [Nocardia salmonicida]|uniref:hypothetical protein n=1 Tax=Nocardia salmonicida TaxID=53431 RepID=UPI00340169A3
MATQGWFNHYDDPDDDYWEQSPEGRTSGDSFKRPSPISGVSSARSPDPVTAPGANSRIPADNSAVLPTSKSSLIAIEIGEDKLPIRAKFSSSWTTQFDSWQYSAAVMDAYQHALHERMIADKKAKVVARSKLPSVYEMAPVLLQTRSVMEYRAALRKLIGGTQRIANGPGVTDFDTPALQMVANEHRITSIKLDPDWAREAGAAVLGMDIVFCADQLRQSVPTYQRDPFLDKESEDEIHQRLAEHLRRISEE